MKPKPVPAAEITAEEFARLKQEADNAKAEHERAKGALTQLMTQLKAEFNCATVAQAKSLLEKLEQDKTTALAKFNKTLGDYNRKWLEQ